MSKEMSEEMPTGRKSEKAFLHPALTVSFLIAIVGFLCFQCFPIFDGGALQGRAVIAAIPYLVIFGMVFVQRPTKPNSIDLFAVYGSLFVLLLPYYRLFVIG